MRRTRTPGDWVHAATLSLCLAAGIGVALLIIGARLKIPYIVLLLVGGVLLGPEGVGWIDPAALGPGLEIVIALAVAVILFEGGLTLDVEGYRRAPRVIRRMLSIGAVVTWLGTAAAVWFFFELSFEMSLMAGSLVIVTGPTVISPILRRLQIRERLHHVLYWEGVLIDVVGVFVAVLCYEWLTPDESFPVTAPIARFGLRLLVGVGLGAVCGICVAFALERRWIPDESVNIFVLGAALLAFGVAHGLLSESGILSVVTAGLVLRLRAPPQLSHVKRFKLELTELGIAILFVLLSAKLDLSQFTGWSLVGLLAVVMLVIRPLGIWLATWGQSFELREKLFLSWLAPRGIVAAAMASLFALRLQELGQPDARYLETVAYAVIATTVTLQGLTAPVVAGLLGVRRKDRRTWVLLGNKTVVEWLGSGLRRAGAKTVDVDVDTLRDDLDLDDPALADAEALLCTSPALPDAAHPLAARVQPNACYRWGTGDDDDSDTSVVPVWAGEPSASSVAEGLLAGTHIIDVIPVDESTPAARFGRSLRPLFWVGRGRASIVPDPLSPGPPEGEFAVVLRRKITGLANLVEHVDIVDDSEVAFETVLHNLIRSAQRMRPDLPTTVFDSIIERKSTMPLAVGSGVAIPHAYWEGLESSHCLLAVVPNGVAHMLTPDEQPIRLVFLLLSPLGMATEHLKSLAAIGSLGEDQAFLDLLASQRVPERVAALIRERA